MRSNLTMREMDERSRELLKDTPMRAEGYNAEREREQAHRALPKGRQPFMVVFMGMLDYGVLWIGDEGPRGETRAECRLRKIKAEREMEWWAKEIDKGLHMIPFTRDPSRHDLQVRQQWDLDALTDAIRRSYR